MRIGRIAQTIDFAPTIYDLAGVAAAPRGSRARASRRSCARPERALSGEAYAEVKVLRLRRPGPLAERGGKLLQATSAAAVMESDGHWVSKETHFDALPPALEFRAVAFHQPREIEVRSTASRRPRCASRPTGRASASISPAGARKHLVSFTTPGCDTPLALGVGEDGRCLSFKLHGPPLERRELFDLSQRPAGGDATSPPNAATCCARCWRGWRAATTTALCTAPADQALSEEQVKHLRALGYLQ